MCYMFPIRCEELRIDHLTLLLVVTSSPTLVGYQPKVTTLACILVQAVHRNGYVTCLP